MQSERPIEDADRLSVHYMHTTCTLHVHIMLHYMYTPPLLPGRPTTCTLHVHLMLHYMYTPTHRAALHVHSPLLSV